MSLSHLKILIVDDSSFTRGVIRAMLRGFDISKTWEAADGEAALARMRDTAVDIVLADLHMQPVDGVELLRRLRMSDDSPNPLVPVIMISSDTSGPRIEAARDAGVSAFLAKPLSPKQLAKRLSYVLDDRRSFIRAAGYVGPDRRFRAPGADGTPQRRSQDAPEAELAEMKA
jgi:two-component system, chemotaxis family, chemotaxis protein CheY